jgi:flagellar assembly protein FliH
MPISSRSRLIESDAAPMEEAFVYRPAQAPIPINSATEAGATPAVPQQGSVESLWWDAAQASRGNGRLTEADLRAREQQAYERGFREGQAQARAEYEKALAGLRLSAAASLEQFSEERKSYFQRVEPEIVRLALSIARKILHREAQIDPLLLSGIVRVALEKVAAGGPVKLRVPAGELSRWLEIMAAQTHLDPPPEVVGDPSLGPAECRLETEVGTTDLSLETQLAEIERGFLDILALRPGS